MKRNDATSKQRRGPSVVSVIDAENRITMETIAKLENECRAVEKFFTFQDRRREGRKEKGKGGRSETRSAVDE